MSRIEEFVGRWVTTIPWDSDDYLVAYDISIVNNLIQIEARDMQDGEKMVISEINFDDNELFFISYMPSTERKGINRFRKKNDDRIESKFTFTVVEELKRIEQTDTPVPGNY